MYFGLWNILRYSALHIYMRIDVENPSLYKDLSGAPFADRD